MDGDPFAKALDRIRLIGRLFFNYIAAMLKEVEIERGSFVNFSQNLLRKSNLLGSIWGHLGQSWGQLMVCTHATCLSTRSLFLSCLIPIVPLLNTNLAFFIG